MKFLALSARGEIAGEKNSRGALFFFFFFCQLGEKLLTNKLIILVIMKGVNGIVNESSGGTVFFISPCLPLFY